MTINGPITLIVGLAQSPDSKRAREYDTCLDRNVNNEYIDRVVIIEEEDGSRSLDVWASHPKVSTVKLARKSFYSDYVEIANRQDGVVVIANADVHFDWSVGKLRVIPNEALCAITRTDCFDNLWSSDAWAFRPRMDVKGCEWSLGRYGCETAFCEQVKRQLNWGIWNPCYEVRLVHVHCSGIYSPERHSHVKFNVAPYPKPVRIDLSTGMFTARL
jgi:hypothetical protein